MLGENELFGNPLLQQATMCFVFDIGAGMLAVPVLLMLRILAWLRACLLSQELKKKRKWRRFKTRIGTLRAKTDVLPFTGSNRF